MIEFEFSKKMIQETIAELRNANEFIKIAIFQLHKKNFFTILKEKIASGIKVEIEK